MTETSNTRIHGAGLGLKRSIIKELVNDQPKSIDFFEVAPENWIGDGGRLGKLLKQIREHTPIICHGLSLSLGSSNPLNKTLINDIKEFLDDFDIPIYSEHLSYTCDDAQLYDLLPLPFTEEAVKHVARRIKQVQDTLERRIAIENVSYYLVPEADMTEVEFVNAVLAEADCDLLLDVNNIYCNSQNHAYDPSAYLQALQPEKVTYIHVAGHFVEPDGIIIDTHGADVIHPVWNLLNEAYERFGPLPTLLERDFNLPEVSTLCLELDHIKQRQTSFQQKQKEQVKQSAA